MRRQMVIRAALAVCALFCALPAHALASATEQSILMDDNHLIYASPSEMYHTLEQAKALGIDRIKVSMVWYLVAPKDRSKKAPHFDATNPAAYPPGAWERYDFLASDARQLGLQLYFDLTPPAPAWGVSRGHAAQGYPWSYRPSAKEFGQFVQEIGRASCRERV